MHAAKGGHDLALAPLLRAGANVQQTDQAARTAIAHATNKKVARRLLEAGAKSNQLPVELCVQLGLSRTECFEESEAIVLRSTKVKQSARNDAPPSGGTAGSSKDANSFRRQDSTKESKADGTKSVLRAGGLTWHPIAAALHPLRLEPMLADRAPLLQLYTQNANKMERGAATIIQRQYRTHRLRQLMARKNSFFQPTTRNKKAPRA